MTNKFEVLHRQYLVGRGYVTVINNKDNIPISTSSVIIQDDEEIPIRGIEGAMTLMTIPKPYPQLGLITNKETTGDYIIVKS